LSLDESLEGPVLLALPALSLERPVLLAPSREGSIEAPVLSDSYSYASVPLTLISCNSSIVNKTVCGIALLPVALRLLLARDLRAFQAAFIAAGRRALFLRWFSRP